MSEAPPFHELTDLLEHDAQHTRADWISGLTQRIPLTALATAAAAALTWFTYAAIEGQAAYANLAAMGPAAEHVSQDLARPNIAHGDPFEIDGRILGVARDTIPVTEPYARSERSGIETTLAESGSSNGVAPDHGYGDPTRLSDTSSGPSLNLLLGTNLGVWGLDDYWGVNENFVKSEEQRRMARGVIGTIRFPIRPSYPGDTTELTDEAYLLVLDAIESVGAVPFVVLPHFDDARAAHIVNLFGSRVTYYEYGNEVDWFSQTSTTDHAEMTCAAIPFLKAHQPHIRIGGNTQGHTQLDNIQQWADHMVATCPGVRPDFISVHKYFAHSSIPTNEAILAGVANLSNELIAIRTAMDQTFGAQLPLVVSEWNWHAVPDWAGDERDMDEEFMMPFTTAVIEQFMQAGVYMAHQYSYGTGSASGRLDMVTWTEPKPQMVAFQTIASQFPRGDDLSSLVSNDDEPADLHRAP